MKDLIQQAYNLKEYQVTSGPGWLASEGYDIAAKAGTDASRDQIRLMLQALLAERFKLVVHRETRDLPIYALVVAKNGPKLRPSAVQPNQPAGGSAAKSNDSGSGSAKRAPAGRAVGAGTTMRAGASGTRISIGNGQMSVQGAPISILVTVLAQQLRRAVLDKTDLKGNFDFKLEWTPFTAQPPSSDEPIPADSGPSIFTALQEQLGLKLESSRGPVDVLVIVRVEKPSDNY